jgi:protein-tyrosine phosphatase
LIDIHCHILPGIDDGPPDLKTALKMARVAVKDGITTIVATPHCYDGVYDCQQYDIRALCRSLDTAFRNENIRLRVVPGAEIRLTPEFLELVEKNKLLTLGNCGKDVLVELPDFFLPAVVCELFKKLRNKKVRCIVAHPERNSLILSNNRILEELVDAGAALQITAGSLTGFWGKEPQLLARKILQLSCRRFLGSDGHCNKKRKPVLAKAKKIIGKLTGNEIALKMVSLKLG